jgi:hypothetical protein
MAEATVIRLGGGHQYSELWHSHCQTVADSDWFTESIKNHSLLSKLLNTSGPAATGQNDQYLITEHINQSTPEAAVTV